MFDLRDLIADPTRVTEVPLPERQRLLASLAAVVLALTTAAPPAAENDPGPGQSPERPSRWLTPTEAAEVARVPRRTIYGWSRRSDWRPFTHRLSRKVLRIEEAGFRLWLERRK